MIKPNEEVLRAIASLSGSQDWEKVRGWLKESLGQALLECSNYRTESMAYPFMSGRAYELKEIVNVIDKAREMLDIIQRRRA